MPQNHFNCPICHAEKTQSFEVKEMMFGLREAFTYALCANCGVIFQRQPPDDLGRYYGSQYYSLNIQNNSGSIKRLLKRLRGKYLFQSKSFLPGWIITKLFGKPDFVHYMAAVNTSFSNAILDVGSGTGYLLWELHAAGFKNLSGIDPFIENDILNNNGINIYKKELKDLDTKYDLIMFNHAFEHMHDHKNILQRVNQLLNDNGRVIIRVPVVNYAWEKYSTNWVQLDAPRHICVFSEKAITLLAKESDLEIEKIIYDSTAFQFWGSEQYKQNIPLRDPRSYAENPARSIFSTKQIIEYSKQAEKLNQEGKGDQACFILRKMIN